MLKLYYSIWSDAILSFKKHHPDRKDWKFTLWFYISFIHGMNLWIFTIWLKYFNIFDFPLIKITLFPGDMLNSFFGFILSFVAPFLIINYFFVFYKSNYLKINKKYGRPKKYAFYYTVTVAILGFITGIMYGLLS